MIRLITTGAHPASPIRRARVLLDLDTSVGPEAVRSYTSALPVAFAGVAELNEPGPARERLHTDIRTAWGHRQPATFNAKRAAVASALAYFVEQEWIGDAEAVLHGLRREHQPTDSRVRPRAEIDQLVIDRRWPLEDRTPWSMLYATAAHAEEVLRLDVEDLARANRRARTKHKGGKPEGRTICGVRGGAGRRHEPAGVRRAPWSASSAWRQRAVASGGEVVGEGPKPAHAVAAGAEAEERERRAPTG
ncbi:hypothetical protein [Saccharothrix xinjiangensis]|uniref:Core-binding (CB) domain-containing protein n=1 Tax=Saccharothrix xinjiangensis TaxID=204798 RepID=A0ABV9YE13_9PSEU